MEVFNKILMSGNLIDNVPIYSDKNLKLNVVIKY